MVLNCAGSLVDTEVFAEVNPVPLARRCDGLGWEVCVEAGTHYLDLASDVDSLQALKVPSLETALAMCWDPATP